MRQAFHHILAFGGVIATLLVAPAFADEVADISALLRTGKVAEALVKTDEVLAKRPGDPQLRFLKGVVLTEQNKSAEAIGIFTKLTEDFRDLPEPYNNLAVLYAAGGQYDKARAALEKAIHTNPSYATAYENLGDVHAKMASQAYDKALALDSSNSAAKSKLTLLRTFPGNGAPKVAGAQVTVPVAAPQVASARPAVQAPAKVAAVPQPVAKVAVAPQPAAKVAVALPVVVKAIPAPQAASVSAKPVEAVAPAPVLAKVETAKAPKPAAKPAPGNDERDAVLGQVNAWAKAWTARDVKAYLSHYSSDFDTPNGASRKAWAEERRARISGKGRIDVKISSPQVVVTGNTAKVTFRQSYQSDRLSTNSRKTLVLAKSGGQWHIKQERAAD